MINITELKEFPDSTDQDYLNELKSKLVKEHLEQLWSIFKEYADKDFEKKLSEDYWARIWEMSLGAILKRNNLNLIRNNKVEGPDLEINWNGQKIFIEAICPQPGSSTNPDSIEENNIVKNDDGSYVGVFKIVEFEKVELRLSSAIHEKTLKLQKYITKGIVNKDDIYIIAISAARIPNSNIKFGYDMGIELNILRTILPIGSEIMPITDIKKGNLSSRFEFKKNNIKSNSEKISKNIFFETKYQGISAIIFTSQKYPFSEKLKERDVFIIKNPNCRNPLSSDLGLKEIEIQVNDKYCTYKKINYE